MMKMELQCNEWHRSTFLKYIQPEDHNGAIFTVQPQKLTYERAQYYFDKK